MNAISLEQTERVWLNAYLPGVPADIDAGIEDYPSLREVFLEHLEKFRERVAYVSIGTEMTYADWHVQGVAFAATGGRQLAALAKAIHERGGGRGLISICAAGGLGITAIVEK